MLDDARERPRTTITAIERILSISAPSLRYSGSMSELSPLDHGNASGSHLSAAIPDLLRMARMGSIGRFPVRRRGHLRPLKACRLPAPRRPQRGAHSVCSVKFQGARGIRIAPQFPPSRPTPLHPINDRNRLVQFLARNFERRALNAGRHENAFAYALTVIAVALPTTAPQ